MDLSSGHRLLTLGTLYTISKGLSSSIGIILIPVYSHFLGKAGYGVISLMIPVTFLLAYIFLQGLQGAWVRLRFDQETGLDLRKFESSIFWYVSLSSIIGLIILWFTGPFISKHIFSEIEFYPIVFLTTCHSAFIIYSILIEEKLQAEHHPGKLIAFNIFRFILIVGFILFFVVVLDRGVIGKIEADVISSGILAILVIITLKPLPPKYVSVGVLKKSLAYGLPLLPHNILGLLNDILDRFIVSILLGITETGIYAMGYNIAAVIRIFILSLTRAYTPVFIKAVKNHQKEHDKGNHEKANDIIAKAIRGGLLIVAVSSCIALALNSVSRELLMIVATKDFEQSWRIIPPVTVGITAMACYAVFVQPVFFHTRHVRLVSFMTGCAVIVNIVFNIILIPITGIMGAALATLISNLLLVFIAIVISQKIMPLPHKWKNWILMGCSFTAGMSVLWIIDVSMQNILARLLLKMVFSILSIIIVAWSAGFRLREIFELARRLHKS